MRLLAGLTIDEIHALTNIDHWFLANIEELIALEGRLRRSCIAQTKRARALARGEAERLFGSAACHAVEHHRNRDSPRLPAAGHSSGLQAGRYVCGGVRGRHALLLLDLRVRRRGQHGRSAACRHPGRRAQPDRSGNRIRLLLLPGGLCASRKRLRSRDGQLEPRNRQHRLRHFGSTVLRAADGGRRAQRLRANQAVRRDRPVRRADAAQPCSSSRGSRRTDHRHQPGIDRSRRGSRAVPAGDRATRAQATSQRLGDPLRRGAADCRPDWLSGRRSPELRARRPSDGNRL